MLDIVEPQVKLQQARGETNPASKKMRTVALDDAAKLLQSGLFTPQEISYFQGIPLPVVQAERRRLDRINEAKQKFLSTGHMQDKESGGYLAIFK